MIPESLKNLPLYALGMVKNPTMRIRAGERVDARMHLLHNLAHLPYDRAVNFAYPKLYPMEFPSEPMSLRMSSVMERGGVALFDTSFELLLFVAREADPNLLAHVFAVTAFDQVDPNAPLPLVDSPISKGLHELIQLLRSRSAVWSRLSVVREGDARFPDVLCYLVEDKTMQPLLPSFGEFVRQLTARSNKK